MSKLRFYFVGLKIFCHVPSLKNDLNNGFYSLTTCSFNHVDFVVSQRQQKLSKLIARVDVPMLLPFNKVD